MPLLGKFGGILTANPSNVEHMLKTNFENYPKGKGFISIMEDFLGHGIFNSDGDLWRVQRKTASYEFNMRSLRNFIMDNVVNEISTRLFPVLEKASETQSLLDLQDVLERFAFDNICKVAFNIDPCCLGMENEVGAEFLQMFDNSALLIAGRFMHPIRHMWRVKKFLDVGSEKKLKKSIQAVHGFAEAIIKARMEEKITKDDEDLLSRFIANHENSTEFLRDVIMSFILAGRDTTSSALTSFFWLLSAYPHVLKNVIKEIRGIRTRSNKHNEHLFFTFEELKEMHYLHAAISEAMRLYPPVPIDTKRCLNDDVLPDGTVVPKGWFITYHAYAMGRMESVWGTDCREFRPERWLENGEFRAESPFKYPVFHGGPRLCLGKDMAYIQMKSIAAFVIERFVVDVQNRGRTPHHVVSLTLRMKGGLLVRLSQRK
ncbi:Cytochrome P450 [Dillenia turbinata]|uniref:Cytochrome P450 n=1 Tax=Dillenia turbinata TaxID=194707 RepID=A0AAN8VYD4_9MAGN